MDARELAQISGKQAGGRMTWHAWQAADIPSVPSSVCRSNPVNPDRSFDPVQRMKSMFLLYSGLPMLLYSQPCRP